MTSTRHTRSTATILTVVIALLVGAVVTPPAIAGEYTVDGTCSAWTSFNHQPYRIAAYPACPTLWARNVVGNFSTAHNEAGGGWRFDAPPGTAIRAAKVDAEITGGRSWGSEIRLFGGPGQPHALYAFCYGEEGCRKNATRFEGFDPPLAGPLIATVRCIDKDGCPNGGSGPRVSIEIASSQITLFDPSPPSASIAGGTLSAPGWHGGQRQLAVSASDNTGIRAARALIDGDSRYSTTATPPCDYSRPIPCSNQTATVDLDLRGFADGQHAVAAQAEDASGNAANSPALGINIDNTSPLEPKNAHVAGGFGWRAGNNFTAVWNNPIQTYAPIAAAAYRLCPQDQPGTSTACREGSLPSPDIRRLAFEVPGPGAWRMRLWLIDAAGNGTPDNGVTINGLGLLASRKGRAASELKVGRRVGRRLKRKPTVKLGRSLKIVGRLTAGKRRKGIRRALLVYRRTSVQGARFRAVGRITTSKRGRFTYRAPAGPSRRLLFVYPGGGRIAGRLATVNMRVRARLGIRRDQKKLLNGDTVTLSGRLRGGRIPPSGARLELQVLSRDRWRPFATPRTNKKGRWSYRYRFETVTGRARFRFRAVLRKQATYPYTAKSRDVAVRVRGQ